MAKESEKAYSAEQIQLLKQSLKLLPLAQDVYNVDSKTAPAGWKLVASATPPQPGVGGFFGKIYERIGPVAVGEPRYAVAFRGTHNIQEKKNFDADAQIVFRQLPAQYYEGLEFVKNFCDKNNVSPADMEFTGHSLGGYLGITIGTTLGTNKVWAFNSPGPTKQIRNELISKIPGLSKPLCCKGLVQIRSSYDVIARWQYEEGKIIDIKTTGGNHGLGSLQEGIEAIISGKPLPVAPPQKPTLSSIFNEISKRLAESKKIINIIDKLHGGQRGKKPPGCGCG